jgi:hypothetical protein
MPPRNLRKSNSSGFGSQKLPRSMILGILQLIEAHEKVLLGGISLN